jgi:hypothetical protein
LKEKLYQGLGKTRKRQIGKKYPKKLGKGRGESKKNESVALLTLCYVVIGTALHTVICGE